jgi:hypothetical protein
MTTPGPQLGVSPGDIPWSRCKTPAYAIDVRAVDRPPGASLICHTFRGSSARVRLRAPPRIPGLAEPTPVPIPRSSLTHDGFCSLLSPYETIVGLAGLLGLMRLAGDFGGVWPCLDPVELPDILLAA